MKYEIPREMFKQRLEDRLNFALIDLMGESHPVKYENVTSLKYSETFKTDFVKLYPNKAHNILLFTLLEGDESPSKAAAELMELGYHFVYFYHGSAEDVVLDKGLN